MGSKLIPTVNLKLTKRIVITQFIPSSRLHSLFHFSYFSTTPQIYIFSEVYKTKCVDIVVCTVLGSSRYSPQVQVCCQLISRSDLSSPNAFNLHKNALFFTLQDTLVKIRVASHQHQSRRSKKYGFIIFDKKGWSSKQVSFIEVGSIN